MKLTRVIERFPSNQWFRESPVGFVVRNAAGTDVVVAGTVKNAAGTDVVVARTVKNASGSDVVVQ